MDNITGGSSGRTGLKTPTTNAQPSITAAAVEFPHHYHPQEELVDRLSTVLGPHFRRFALTSGVEHRHLAVSMDRMEQLSGFTEANEAYLEVALDIGELALLAAFEKAKVNPAEVDVVFSTTVTGLAVPSLEARLAARLEPFDSYWQAPKDVEKGFTSFTAYYRANYLGHMPPDRQALPQVAKAATHAARRAAPPN